MPGERRGRRSAVAAGPGGPSSVPVAVAVYAGLAAAVTLHALRPGPAAAQPSGAAADTARPSVRAVRIGGGEEPARPGPPRPTPAGTSGEAAPATAIRLDGRLAEPAWQRAPAATGFRQRDPDEGEPATQTTEVRVLYDDEALYVAVTARDRSPGEIIARILQRDRLLRPSEFGEQLQWQGDDGVALLFDTFHDHRNGMVFATNPNGAQFDALVTDEGAQMNMEWRGVWDVEARVTGDGWIAEFRLPFRTLRYPDAAADRPWGFNVTRMIRRRNEEALWTAWSRENEGFTRVSRAGHLTGLAELPRSGLNLEVKPYLLTGATQLPEAPGGTAGASPATGTATDPRFEMGLDAKYEVRPGLVLDLTVNPDFAQVEVDEERVNLTRFSLFFPEQRDFFLENAGVFEFGQRGFGFEPPPFLLFFSRRVGLHQGEEVPVLGGARLTGRVGEQTVGVLDVVTGQETAAGLPTTNHAVLRVKRDVGENGYLGAMLTDLRRIGGDRPVGPDGGPSGDPGGGASSGSGAGAADPPANTALGVDGSIWATDRLNFQGFLARTVTEGAGGDDVAYRGAVDYNSDLFGLFAQHMYIGPETRAGMGFITRRDVRKTGGFTRVRPRPEALGLLKIDIGLSGEYLTNAAGDVRDWEAGAFFSPEWESGEDLRLTYDRTFTRLVEPFEVSGQVRVPPGDYLGWRWALHLTTSSNRPVWGRARLRLERFFGGTLASGGGDVNVSPGRHLSFQLRYTHNDVELPGGAFTADVLTARAEYALSTRLFANGVIQYNSLNERVSTNFRVRFIHTPGSDLFLVLSEERGRGLVPGSGVDGERGPVLNDDLWDLRSRGVVMKLTYLLRL